MVDLDRATQLFGFDGRLHQEADQHRELLGPGSVHADFSDPDHVFLVTVQQVPRHRLIHTPRTAAQLPDGTTVQLLTVDLANHITVALSATGPAAESAAAEYRSAFEHWGQHPEQNPPVYPAEVLSPLSVHLADDVGTVYGWTSAETGHPDDPWRFVIRSRPTPPPDARTLRVRVADGVEVRLDLPYWNGV